MFFAVGSYSIRISVDSFFVEALSSCGELVEG